MNLSIHGHILHISIFNILFQALGVPVVENEGTWHNLALISDAASMHGKEKVTPIYGS